jgi:plastocyanin
MRNTSSRLLRSTEPGASVTIAAGVNASCRRLACVAAALAVLVSGPMSDMAQGAVTAARQRKRHTVTIEGTSFQPERLTVAAGDTVVWVNKDPFPHTATSTTGGFDSGRIAPDKSWKFTPVKKGELGYICALHPTMKGLLKVE